MAEPTVHQLPKCMMPSSMASRRAEREARGELEPQRRLVSLGWHRETVEGLGRDDKPTRRQFEMVYDADKPAQVYVRLSLGGALVPLARRTYDNGGANRVIDAGVMPRRARPSGYHAMGRPDEVVWRSGDDD